MKTLLFCLFAVSVMFANYPEKIDYLASKVILKNTDGYFALADGSFWKAITFVKRWRTPSEWWNSVELIPPSYECVPDSWVLGTEIQVFSKYGNNVVNEANASNQEAIKQCTHVLVNARTGQGLFAISLHPADCLNQISKDVSKESFEAGFNKGRLESFQDATHAYNTGRQAGYQDGYQEGYKAAMREMQPGSI